MCLCVILVLSSARKTVPLFEVCKSVEMSTLQGERKGDSGLVCLKALTDLVGGIVYFPFVLLLSLSDL